MICRLKAYTSFLAVDWPESMSKYVNNMERAKYDPSVRDSMGYYPRPPNGRRILKQGPGVDISIKMGEGEAQRELDMVEQGRRDFRYGLYNYQNVYHHYFFI